MSCLLNREVGNFLANIAAREVLFFSRTIHFVATFYNAASIDNNAASIDNNAASIDFYNKEDTYFCDSLQKTDTANVTAETSVEF
jgi:hypothetical protein